MQATTVQKDIKEISTEMTGTKGDVSNLDIEIKDLQRQIKEILLS